MSHVDLGPAARQLADLVTRVTDAELDRPTPCPAYTVGDLVEHAGGLALAFAAAARKDFGPYTALAAAWAETGAWTGMTRIAGGYAPAEVVGLTAADELVVHGWDLAAATGQPYASDAAALEAARQFLGMFASPDAPAGPDVPFGPVRPVADDAPPLHRVLGLAGRDPFWLSPAGS